MSKTLLHKINLLLSVLIISICLYVIIFPLLPEVNYRNLSAQEQVEFVDQVRTDLAASKPAQPLEGVNRLVIPKISVQGQVFEGNSFDILNNGIWRRPNTSTPEQGGNTVFVAHRYLYAQQKRSFYHLPKVEAGDEIYLFWGENEYQYEVFSTETVEPDATWVEDQTDEDILTLYTCTPLWTAQQRFVVRARPVEIKPVNQTT